MNPNDIKALKMQAQYAMVRMEIEMFEFNVPLVEEQLTEMAGVFRDAAKVLAPFMKAKSK